MSLTSAAVIATGGDSVEDIDGYRIHKFTATGSSSFVVTRGGPVEVLVVAGGGGGGGIFTSFAPGGGGGAGELIYRKNYSISGVVFITVGDGGFGGSNNAPIFQNSTNGQNSIFGDLIAIGGGRGGGDSNGGGGGSGGGGSRGWLGGASIAVTGFGNAGGKSIGDRATGTANGGGGGGAGGQGLDSYNNSIKTPGGGGLSYNISGISKTYATGGRGGQRDGSPSASATVPMNTGDGGNGASTNRSIIWGSEVAPSGSNGGSGIVIVRYPIGMVWTGKETIPRGIFTATPNGLASDQPAVNAFALRQGYPGYGDGVYWINCGGVPKQTYCLMDPKWDGGGWMLIMKAAQGSTFNWGSTHWTTTSTLNPTDTTTTVTDAKFDVFNSVPVTDVMAVWPASDVGAGNTGGSLSVSDGWVWLVKGWYPTPITPLAGFQIDRPAIPPDIFNFSGFSTSSPIWSHQTGLRAHVFGSGSHVPSAPGSDVYFTRWGFMWNNESGTTHTQDAFAGIGLNIPSSSGGDFWFWEYVDKKGFNRNIAWLMYGR